MNGRGRTEAGGSAGETLAALSALAGALRTDRFGRTLHALPSAASTNDVAWRLAEDGAPEGTAVIALEQTAGRGRRGRTWRSPAGGLYLSVVLRPRLPPPMWPLLSLAAAVGAAEGVEAAGLRDAGSAVSVKWPNDLQVRGRKVGGILLEAGQGFAVCGVGINAGGADGLPEEAGGVGLPLVPLARAVLEGLEAAVDNAYADPAGLIALWKARSATLGRRVTVTGTEVFEGVAEDIDVDGALIVRTPEGRRRVVAGDVSVR